MSTERLHEAVASVAPIVGISVPTAGTSVGVTVAFDASATPQQRANAQAVVDAFDWSESAHNAWLAGKLRAAALSAVSADTSKEYKLLRAVVSLVVSEINALLLAAVRPITSITRAGTTATVTTVAAHGLSSGASVLIHGAAVAAYNGTKTITVTGATTFTYGGVNGNPATPAAGSLVYMLSAAPLPLARTQAQAVAAIQNTVNSGAVD